METEDRTILPGRLHPCCKACHRRKSRYQTDLISIRFCSQKFCQLLRSAVESGIARQDHADPHIFRMSFYKRHDPVCPVFAQFSRLSPGQIFSCIRRMSAVRQTTHRIKHPRCSDQALTGPHRFQSFRRHRCCGPHTNADHEDLPFPRTAFLYLFTHPCILLVSPSCHSVPLYLNYR